MNLSLLRRPSAFLPVAMSLVALIVVLANVALFGAHREADEGAAAHVFQFLVAVQGFCRSKPVGARESWFRGRLASGEAIKVVGG